MINNANSKNPRSDNTKIAWEELVTDAEADVITAPVILSVGMVIDELHYGSFKKFNITT